MGMYEYMMLNEEEQWNCLWSDGTFLTHHIESENKYSVYALYAFFVEVKLDSITNKIIGKGHFISGETLDRYSGNIDIFNV